MKLKELALAAALTVAGSQPEAATLQVVYTGTVISGNAETYPLFGAPVLDLVGQNFVLMFRYDTSRGELVNIHDRSGALKRQLLRGGTLFEGSPTNPILYAGLTINHVTQTVTGGYEGFEDRGGYNPDTSYGGTVAHDVYTEAGVDIERFIGGIGTLPRGSIPLDVSAGYSTDTGADSMFFFGRADHSNPLGISYGTMGWLHTTKVVFSAYGGASNVPLPASGLLLIAGVGGFAALRMRAA